MWWQKLPDVSPAAETLSHLEPQMISQLNRTTSILKCELPLHSTLTIVLCQMLCWGLEKQRSVAYCEALQSGRGYRKVFEEFQQNGKHANWGPCTAGALRLEGTAPQQGRWPGAPGSQKFPLCWRAGDGQEKSSEKLGWLVTKCLRSGWGVWTLFWWQWEKSLKEFKWVSDALRWVLDRWLAAVQRMHTGRVGIPVWELHWGSYESTLNQYTVLGWKRGKTLTPHRVTLLSGQRKS